MVRRDDTRPTDLVDELIERRRATRPDFDDLVSAALDRRQLMRALGDRRRALGLTQTQVAALIGTSQSAVARMERGESDLRLSSIERFADAVGARLTLSLTFPC